MSFNKNHIIYVLSALSVSLILYIIFEKPSVQTVTKIEYEDKIIYKDRVVYKEKMIDNNNSEYVEIEPACTQQSERLEDNQKEKLISSTTDVSHRYKISLVSDEEIPKIDNFKKIVFKGKIIGNERENIFIMDVNQAILENLYNIYFKVLDTQTDEEYINYSACVYNTVANYVYEVNLELTGGAVFCTMTQERELPPKAQGLMLQSEKTTDVKNKILKVDGILPKSEE